MEAKVSVIIPVFNAAKTIEETINSIQSQVYKNIEVILVNDGSTDESHLKVQEIIKKKSLDFNYYVLENGGPSKARNFGASKAKGEYLLFLDADDKIHAEYISNAIHIFKSNSEINLIYADVELFGDEQGLWKLKDFKVPDFLLENCIPIFAIIKREHFIQVNGFDEQIKFAEDWELWIRIYLSFGGVYKIPEIMYYYRKTVSENSLTERMRLDNQIDLARLYIFTKHYDFYVKNNLSISDLVLNIHRLNALNKKYNNNICRKIFNFFFKSKS